MREKHVFPQTWPFSCLSCEHAWEVHYEAWHIDDGRGGNSVTWRHKGAVTMPPWIDPMCPSCAGLRVRTFPPALANGHASDAPSRPGTESGNGSPSGNGPRHVNGVSLVDGTSCGSAAGAPGGDPDG
jgi:hypothetical protein